MEAEWVGCGGAPTIDGRLESLSIGSKHVCGLRPGRSDNVVCWGSNQFGEAAPPWGEFKKLTLGTRHTCGLRPAGEVECWGRNEFGESSPPNGVRKPVVAGSGLWGGGEVGKSAPPYGEFSDLALGDGFSCALLSALPPQRGKQHYLLGAQRARRIKPPTRPIRAANRRLQARLRPTKNTRQPRNPGQPRNSGQPGNSGQRGNPGRPRNSGGRGNAGGRSFFYPHCWGCGVLG